MDVAWNSAADLPSRARKPATRVRRSAAINHFHVDSQSFEVEAHSAEDGDLATKFILPKHEFDRLCPADSSCYRLPAHIFFEVRWNG